MSRVLKTGTNQITQTYKKHAGWSKGVDVVKYKSQLEYIVAHTAGKVIKTVDYMDGTNKVPDREAMGYGNYVMILHNQKYEGKYIVTLYAHGENVAVKQNQQVSKGQELFFMGNTGNSDGAHLHFEIRLYKESPQGNLHDTSKFEWIDPTMYLDRDLPVTKSTQSASAKIYRIQVSSFSISSNAVKYAKTVINKGFNAKVYKSGNNYRVQIGQYTTKSSAEQILAAVKKSGYKDAYITTESGTEVKF